MLVSTDQLMITYSNYKSPRNKISSLVKQGKLIPLKRGLYESEASVPGYELAGCLYGPSYISFEYALFYYGMIPERVTVYTSATFRKNRSKEFINDFGVYTYKDVPSNAYPQGYIRVEGEFYPFLIAEREKALCDYLSILPPIRGKKDFKEYLFDGMRLDEEEFEDMDFARLCKYASLYHKTNLDQLIRLVE